MSRPRVRCINGKELLEMKQKLLMKAALAMGLLTPVAVSVPAFAADEPDPTRNVSGTVGVTFTTDYISRGLVLENQGVIAQPYGELGFKLLENKEGLQKVTLYGGIWNSLHSEHTDVEGDRPGESSTTDIWYEFDWYVGVSLDFADKFNLKISYWEFISPADAFGTSHNLEFRLSYNDAGMWGGDFALNPYGVVFFELDGKAGNGIDEGIYVELGIAPGLPPIGDVKIAFPIAVGLGFSDFYGNVESDGSVDDEVFGYVTAGVVASMPIKFMSDAGFGNWTWSVGGNVYYFGEALEDFNEGNVKGDSELEWVAFTGVSIGF